MLHLVNQFLMLEIEFLSSYFTSFQQKSLIISYFNHSCVSFFFDKNKIKSKSGIMPNHCGRGYWFVRFLQFHFNCILDQHNVSPIKCFPPTRQPICSFYYGWSRNWNCTIYQLSSAQASLLNMSVCHQQPTFQLLLMSGNTLKIFT